LSNARIRKAEVEHFVVSNVAKVIPESVKSFWRDYRAAFKRAERERMGNNEVSERAEMAGWGVKEAAHKNKEEASKQLLFHAVPWRFGLADNN
jgi:N-terminal acetyltransferase 2